jgi:dCMP deaminase
MESLRGQSSNKATRVSRYLILEVYNMKTQESWDRFYLGVATKVADLSYATDKKVGCVIVREDNILSFSYNGTYPGSNNNTEVNGVTPPTVYHAEEAAICKLAFEGRSTKGCTMYVTMSPCIQCAKLILRSGIVRVVYQMPYKDLSGVNFLKQHGVVVNDIMSNTMLFSKEELKHTGLL